MVHLVGQQSGWLFRNFSHTQWVTMYYRGGLNNKHSGNERLRQLARQYGGNYKSLTKKEKSDLSRYLVRRMRELDPPARYESHALTILCASHYLTYRAGGRADQNADFSSECNKRPVGKRSETTLPGKRPVKYCGMPLVACWTTVNPVPMPIRPMTAPPEPGPRSCRRFRPKLRRMWTNTITASRPHGARLHRCDTTSSSSTSQHG
jgi:hypothetical protein